MNSIMPYKGSEYLTTAEAASYLNISKQYLEIRRCRHDGGPATVRVGRAVRYRKSALDEWMTLHESPGSTLTSGSENGGTK